MARIVIFGAGDIARLAHFYFGRDSEHEVAAFAVDRAFKKGDEFLGLPLVAAEDVAERYPSGEYQVFVAVSYAKMNRVRREKYEWFQGQGYRFATYVSSRCTYLADARPGPNCFILEDNTIQPFARIGANVTLWSGNHIGHDSTIGDHTFITSHVVVSGNVTVGESCFIGVNATLRNSIAIGDRTLVGAGALIMKDTEPDSVFLGTRAERFRKRSSDVEL